MSTPMLLLGFILSTLYGAFFHLLRGGKAGRLLLYLILAWVGFWFGQLVGSYLPWSFDSIGQLHVLFATVGSLIFLIIGNWLSQVQVENKPIK